MYFNEISYTLRFFTLRCKQTLTCCLPGCGYPAGLTVIRPLESSNMQFSMMFGSFIRRDAHVVHVYLLQQAVCQGNKESEALQIAKMWQILLGLLTVSGTKHRPHQHTLTKSTVT